MSKVIHQIFLDIGLKPLSERNDYLRNIELLKVFNKKLAQCASVKLFAVIFSGDHALVFLIKGLTICSISV